MDTNDVIVLDGFLEEPSVPGDLHGSTARFRLTISPTDERTDEMVLPCNVTDPALAFAAIHDLAPGDTLRVTGHLHLPRTPGDPMWLAVTTLTVRKPLPSSPTKPPTPPPCWSGTAPTSATSTPTPPRWRCSPRPASRSAPRPVPNRSARSSKRSRNARPAGGE